MEIRLDGFQRGSALEKRSGVYALEAGIFRSAAAIRAAEHRRPTKVGLIWRSAHFSSRSATTAILNKMPVRHADGG